VCVCVCVCACTPVWFSFHSFFFEIWDHVKKSSHLKLINNSSSEKQKVGIISNSTLNKFVTFFQKYLNFFPLSECYTLWHLHKCLQYISTRFTSSILLPYSLSSLLRIFSTGFVVLLLFMSTKYFYHICPPSHFPYALPSPTSIYLRIGPVLPSYSPFFFLKTFLLAYGSYTGAVIVTFPNSYMCACVRACVCVCVYYIPNWFIPFIILSILVPFLW
jgi:hypothetical protein